MEKAKISGDCSEDLKKNSEKDLRDLMSHFLSLLEVALPFSPNDNSDNEKRFTLIRSKILRLGNDKIRALDSFHNQYACFKLSENISVESEQGRVDIINFKNQFQIGGKDHGN